MGPFVVLVGVLLPVAVAFMAPLRRRATPLLVIAAAFNVLWLTATGFGEDMYAVGSSVLDAHGAATSWFYVVAVLLEVAVAALAIGLRRRAAAMPTLALLASIVSVLTFLCACVLFWNLPAGH